MLVTDRLVFLQLQKSACTHIADLLQRRLGGEIVDKHTKHQPLQTDPGDKLVVISVRNPWDWYVSLWAFGCGKKGATHRRMTASRRKVLPRAMRDGFHDPRLWRRWPGVIGAYATRRTEYWKELYADPRSPELFRTWLKVVLTEEGKRYETEDYPYLSIHRVVGFYTYRFVRLSALLPVWQREAPRLRTLDDLRAFYEAHNIVDRYVRQDALEEDLATVLSDLGPDLVTADELRESPINSSKRDKAAMYHDAETIALVAEQEQFVIDRFGFKPPALRQDSA